MKAYINMVGNDLFDRLHAAPSTDLRKEVALATFVNHLNATVVEHGVRIVIWRRTLIEHRVPAHMTFVSSSQQMESFLQAQQAVYCSSPLL